MQVSKKCSTSYDFNEIVEVLIIEHAIMNIFNVIIAKTLIEHL